MLLLGALLSAPAWGYPIDVSYESEGLDVAIEPVQLDMATVVVLRNFEPRDVRCDVVFENGPEVARRRKVTVEAGGQRTTRFQPRRRVVRMRISVNCWPADEDE